VKLAPMMTKRHRPGVYECTHAVVDSVKILVGVDLSPILLSRVLSWRHRLIEMEARPAWNELALVMFRRRGGGDHIGLWHQGRVAHLNALGFFIQPLPQLVAQGWDGVRFFKWDK